MDAVLQDFLGNKPSRETPSLEFLPADTQEHQEMDNKVVQEKTGEAVQEQAEKAIQGMLEGAAKLAHLDETQSKGKEDTGAD